MAENILTMMPPPPDQPMIKQLMEKPAKVQYFNLLYHYIRPTKYTGMPEFFSKSFLVTQRHV